MGNCAAVGQDPPDVEPEGGLDPCPVGCAARNGNYGKENGNYYIIIGNILRVK